MKNSSGNCCSFSTQRKDYQAFQKFGKGDIIVLLGTSTSGKSSLIRAITNIEPERKEAGVDLSSRSEVISYIKNNYEDEFDLFTLVIEDDKKMIETDKEVVEVDKEVNVNMNILYAIFDRKFYFKNGVTEKDKERVKALAPKLCEEIDKNISYASVDDKIMEKVIKFSKEGISSIFDIIKVKSAFRHIIKRHFHGPIRTALVYCPFHLISDRIAERNTKALEDERYEEVRASISVRPLFQFTELFQPKTHDNEIVLEKVTRKMVEEAFDKNFNFSADYQKKMAPEDYEKRDVDKERIEKKQKLLEAFGFTKSTIQEIELTPRFQKYDYLIDTSKASAAECAKLFKRGI